MPTSLRPPLPAPPHLGPPDDPTWLVMGAVQGWRDAQLHLVERGAGEGALALAALPGQGRSLAEASGSFGGLVAPSNVAVSPQGTVYLLDRAAALLHVFDPCECRFRAVPCTGGAGTAARELREPGGIAVHGGNLYICDTGNARVSVFTIAAFVLRGHWTLPPAPGIVTWTPTDIAFDLRGRAFVSDPANGCIHVYARGGRWERCLPSVGSVSHLAVDCCDRLYAAAAADAKVQIFDPAGEPGGRASKPQEVAAQFPPLPFRVETDGTLDFGEPCGTFDQRGRAIARPPSRAAPAFERLGRYVTTALDSKLYRCQWHRVVLWGEVPAGTSMTVETYGSEVEQPVEHILSLPDAAWRTGHSAHAVERGAWDCLVRSAPGRFLWLRISFRGDGAATPRLTLVRVEFPRVGLSRHLPAVFGQDPTGGDFTDRFLALFDTTLRGIEEAVDHQARLYDPRSTPAEPDRRGGVDFLAWIASWIGLTLDRSWPVEKRRRLVAAASRVFDRRGTRGGLRALLLLYLDWEPPGGSRSPRCARPSMGGPCECPPRGCEAAAASAPPYAPPPLILEHFQLRRWLVLGTGRLGDEAVLWGKGIVSRSRLDDGAQADRTRLVAEQDPYRDPFHVYAARFSVFVPACFGRSATHHRALRNLLRAESPGHARWHLELVEPRFRIGVQSMIGFDAVVGRPPHGMAVGTAALGRESMLGEPPQRRGAGTMRVGRESQVGITTLLD